MTLRRSNLPEAPAAPPTWQQTIGEVTACKYQFARMNTLTLGIAADRNQFLITFTYHADGKLYTDQFTAPTYVEQGCVLAVSYNPLAPQQNSRSASSTTTGTPLFGLAVAGSVVLSVVYFAFLRGCT